LDKAELFGRLEGIGHFTGSLDTAELFGRREGGFLLVGFCKSLCRSLSACSFPEGGNGSISSSIWMLAQFTDVVYLCKIW
jgi:hypothetical protein